MRFLWYPLVLEERKIGQLIVDRIGLDVEADSSKLDDWAKIVESLRITDPQVPMLRSWTRTL